jgi:2-amino-4-hydroxy-6-hydroxymethyldihydropteridine diphosphokinase
MKNRAFLLLGGNTGNRAAFLEQARKEIAEKCGAIVKSSSIYETAAWGKEDQPAFLNQVICIATKMTSAILLAEVLNIEKKMGRVREQKYAPRIIDIDILFFNQEVLVQPGLTLPHPEIQNRRFVLEPLAELLPMKRHPVLHKTIKRLLRDCTDPLEVKKYIS